MKNSLLLLIAFLAIVLSSCTRNEVVITETEIPEDIFYLHDELKPYSGRCLVYYTNSEIVKDVMHYKQGYLNGERKSFYKNGQIKFQGDYNYGKLNGTWKKFTDSGEVIFIATYHNDSLITFEGNDSITDKNTLLPSLIPANPVKVVATVLF